LVGLCTVPINAAAVAMLGKYLFAWFGSGLADVLQYLFPGRFPVKALDRWQANQIGHAVFDKAGLGSRESYGTHSLRKWFRLRVHTVKGYDIALTRAIVGQADIDTTQRYLYGEETKMVAAVHAIEMG
jgi:site-specific recombinase XerD